MTDAQWYVFFQLCASTLGVGSYRACDSNSWCAWTTFNRLEEDIHYWTSGLPNLDEIAPTHIKDGGVWGQPFSFQELAHIIIPSMFSWERGEDGEWESGKKKQDIERLSSMLTDAKISHRKTKNILEIKLY